MKYLDKFCGILCILNIFCMFLALIGIFNGHYNHLLSLAVNSFAVYLNADALGRLFKGDYNETNVR